MLTQQWGKYRQSCFHSDTSWGLHVSDWGNIRYIRCIQNKSSPIAQVHALVKRQVQKSKLSKGTGRPFRTVTALLGIAELNHSPRCSNSSTGFYSLRNHRHQITAGSFLLKYWYFTKPLYFLIQMILLICLGKFWLV